MTRIELPMPPRLSDCYGNSKTRGRKKTQTYLAYQKLAGQEMMAQRVKPVSGEVRVDIKLVAQNNHAQDGDNRLKALFDTLKKFEIIEDDSNKVVKFHSVEWMDSGPACVVTISSISKENAA